MCKFKDAAILWRDSYQNQIEYYTTESYKSPLKQAIAHFGERDLESILPIEIKQFIDIFVSEGKSRQTVNLRLIVLNHIFRYSIIEGLCKENPATLIRLPRNLPKDERLLPPEIDIETVRNIQTSNIFWSMAKCVLYMGLRRGELLALSKESVDLKSGRLLVDRQVEFHGNNPIMKVKTKTSSGVRSIIIPTPLLDSITPLISNTDYYLFCDDNGRLLSLKDFRSGWASLGLQSTMHQFRHAYATLLYEAGVDEKVAQVMLGHSSPVTTRKIYVHLRENQIKKAETQLNQYLFNS